MTYGKLFYLSSAFHFNNCSRFYSFLNSISRTQQNRNIITNLLPLRISIVIYVVIHQHLKPVWTAIWIPDTYLRNLNVNYVKKFSKMRHEWRIIWEKHIRKQEKLATLTVLFVRLCSTVTLVFVGMWKNFTRKTKPR